MTSSVRNIYSSCNKIKFNSKLVTKKLYFPSKIISSSFCTSLFSSKSSDEINSINSELPQAIDENYDIKEHRFSVAPMMDYTDRHQRYFFSLISSKSVLYTEMVTCNALVRNFEEAENKKQKLIDDNIEMNDINAYHVGVDRFLEADFHLPNPLVLQLGGNNVEQMYKAAKLGKEFGYNEININCGCPSPKVSGDGCFGAALMLQPQLLIQLCNAVTKAANKLPTVKCRIGVNDQDSYEFLSQFIKQIHSQTGVEHFIVHARKAVLNANFSPADNRNIPPLKYDYVYRLVQEFPHLHFTINGGILNYEDCLGHINQGVHGVMVGRGVVNTPYYWRHVDNIIYNDNDANDANDANDNVLNKRIGNQLNRYAILDKYGDYCKAIEETRGPKSRRALMKPVLGLFAGELNGRKFRSNLDSLILNQNMNLKEVFLEAASVLNDDTLLSA